jgi:hypothetical protein
MFPLVVAEALTTTLRGTARQKNEDTVAVTAKAIEERKPYPVVAIIAGGDRGVDFTDALSEYCGLLSNSTDIPNRRQEDPARARRSCGSTLCSPGREAPSLATWSPFSGPDVPCCLEAHDSAGSDGVKLCHTFEEAKDRTPSWAGNAVNGGANWCSCSGIPQGKEYVVDHSSRDGVHKTMMVWVYDKRPANGASSLCMAASQLTRNRPRPRCDPLRAWSARCHWIQAWGFARSWLPMALPSRDELPH